MAKLRKMLGKIDSQECVALMALIETQSKMTLFKWAVRRVRERYLPVYEGKYPEDLRLRNALEGCEKHLAGEIKLAELKLSLKEVRLMAAEVEDPTAQAAARAVATACAVVQTPTNALGYLFYGAAAMAYHRAGLERGAEEYDALASEELAQALESLCAVAVENEPNPAKIQWSC